MKAGDEVQPSKVTEDSFPWFFSPCLVRVLRKELRSGLWRREMFLFLFLAALPVLGICAGIYPEMKDRIRFYPDVLIGVSVVTFLWYIPARTLFSCMWDRGGRDFIRLLPGGETGWARGRFGAAMWQWLVIALVFSLFWFMEYAIVGSVAELYLLRFFVLLCTSVILVSMSIWIAETNWFWRFVFILILLLTGGYPLLYTLGYLVKYTLPGNQYFYWADVLRHFASWLPFVALQAGLMAYSFLILASRAAFPSLGVQAVRLRRVIWLQVGFGTALFFLSEVKGSHFDGPLPYFTGVCFVFTAVLFWADAALGLRPVFCRSLCERRKWFRYPDFMKFPGWQSSVADFWVLCLLCSVVSLLGHRVNGNAAGLESIVFWFPLLFWANCVFVFMVTRLLFRSFTPQILPLVIVFSGMIVHLFGHAFSPGGKYSEALGMIPFLNLEFCRAKDPVSWGALAFIALVLFLYGVLSWKYWRRYEAFMRKQSSAS